MLRTDKEAPPATIRTSKASATRSAQSSPACPARSTRRKGALSGTVGSCSEMAKSTGTSSLGSDHSTWPPPPSSVHPGHEQREPTPDAMALVTLIRQDMAY